ncbi:hypothetical protein, partial [Corynebacterium sp.]|uniref:hypothetical protein n=1 Tax=Corynebacterium sp. TaxID=1720 RepID=UPI002647D365
PPARRARGRRGSGAGAGSGSAAERPAGPAHWTVRRQRRRGTPWLPDPFVNRRRRKADSDRGVDAAGDAPTG